MSKKLPEGYNVKTITDEINLVEKFGWVILKDGFTVRRSIGCKHLDRIDARSEGVKNLWETIAND